MTRAVRAGRCVELGVGRGAERWSVSMDKSRILGWLSANSRIVGTGFGSLEPHPGGHLVLLVGLLVARVW